MSCPTLSTREGTQQPPIFVASGGRWPRHRRWRVRGGRGVWGSAPCTALAPRLARPTGHQLHRAGPRAGRGWRWP